MPQTQGAPIMSEASLGVFAPRATSEIPFLTRFAAIRAWPHMVVNSRVSSSASLSVLPRMPMERLAVWGLIPISWARGMTSSSSPLTVMDRPRSASFSLRSTSASFSSKEKLAEVLRRLKEADLGLSITVSGLLDEVIPLAQEMGIKPHTANLSMGILGRTDKLADEETLEFTTMCGHALIAANLVKKGISDVARGAKTLREASDMIGAPCVCGIYNLDRSDLLLQQRVGSTERV